MPIFNESNSINEISNLDENQQLVGTLHVSLRGSVITDADYIVDMALEPYDEFLARINHTNREAVDLYAAARDRDPIIANQLRTAADSIWKSNLSEFQRRFLRRAKL